MNWLIIKDLNEKQKDFLFDTILSKLDERLNDFEDNSKKTWDIVSNLSIQETIDMKKEVESSQNHGSGKVEK